MTLCGKTSPLICIISVSLFCDLAEPCLPLEHGTNIDGTLLTALIGGPTCLRQLHFGAALVLAYRRSDQSPGKIIT